MAVSKRLRYEVLRRDNYTCRYCGRSAPDVEVTVDHVIPKALGGSDDPTNLCAACGDCNGGKTSSSPDAPLVADVAEDALRWAQAMSAAAGEMLARASGDVDAHSHFEKAWARYGSGPERRPLPKDPGWRSTVDSLLAAGLPMSLLEECIEIAMGQRRVAEDNVFRYMCGVAWRKVRELQERARELAQDSPEGEPEGPDIDEIKEAGVQRWCRLILGQRKPEDVEIATHRCRGYTEEDDPGPNSILWFTINMLEEDRSALYDGLRDLMQALPGDVGADLIREHEAFYKGREAAPYNIPYNRFTALFTASQYAAERVAHARARQEMALMPRDEYEAWIQRARDENADWLEHVNDEYIVAEAGRMAREAVPASSPAGEG